MKSAEDNQDELTSADEVAEPPSSPLRRSPGGMLMAQRETLELSLQQVADQLHLTMHFVRAIESDSYDKLPGDVFVRGYIRTYARLLRLDPDQVLMIYDEFNSHKIARKEEAIKRRDRRRKDKNRPWVIVSGVAFVSVAVALWYLNPAQPSDSATDAAFASEEATDIAAGQSRAETVADAAVAQSMAGTVAAPVAVVPSADLPDAVVDGAVVEQAAQSSQAVSEPAVQAELPVPAQIADPANSSNAAAGTATSETAAGGELMTTTQAPASASAMQPAVSGRTAMEYWAGADELRIGFSADSAVHIEHKGGAEMHEQVHVAGETLVIRGTAPFSVLLGDARNVSLSFNGRQIDISSNIRADNSARLSIGM